MICQVCQASLPADALYCSRCGSSTHLGSAANAESTVTYLEGQALLSPDTVLANRYRIIRIVGRGGMGIVYEAEDKKLGRPVALKLLPPELKIDPEARKRFLHEARAAASLESPNICTVHEIHDEGDNPFISLEFINGMSLRERLNSGPLGVREAVDIAIQVASGLQVAARKGVIHRDIKSANIMITRDGHAKIMDFGLAKAAGSTMQTKSGAVMGTAAYMSPEQGRGECVDERTDIWSLGIVLYEMLSGQLPFKGGTLASLIYAAVHTEPRPLKDISSAIPNEVDSTVRKALAKNPDDRYSSAGEMLFDLRKGLVVLGPVSNQHDETFGLVEKKGRVALVFLAFVGIILVVVWITGRRPDVVRSAASRNDDRVSQAAEGIGQLPAVPDPNKEFAETITRIRQALAEGDLESALTALKAAESVFPGRQEIATARAAYEAVRSVRKIAASKPAPSKPIDQKAENSFSADDEVFAGAVRRGTASAYAEYLKKYPNGRNSVKALEILRELEADAIAEKNKLTAELDDSRFNSAKLQGTLDGLQAYLESFPEGRHKDEAREMMASLERPIAMDADYRPHDIQQSRKAGDKETLSINGADMVMAWIPAGTFQMGTTEIEGSRNQRPVHSVTISKGFWIGIYEATQAQWTAVMGANPSKFRGQGQLPVESVSWEDCQAFLRELSRLTNESFRLPTEAEWEYACRAGSSDKWYGEWNSVAWHAWNSKGEPHEVGQKRPNVFGLYDMIGNVREWCGDWYAATYFRVSPSTDPSGPSSGKERVIRGGGWKSEPERANATIRYAMNPLVAKEDLGFRLVREDLR